MKFHFAWKVAPSWSVETWFFFRLFRVDVIWIVSKIQMFISSFILPEKWRLSWSVETLFFFRLFRVDVIWIVSKIQMFISSFILPEKWRLSWSVETLFFFRLFRVDVIWIVSRNTNVYNIQNFRYYFSWAKFSWYFSWFPPLQAMLFLFLFSYFPFLIHFEFRIPL